MGWSGWLQLAALAAALLVSSRLLGAYIARIYGGAPVREDRVFAPVERVIYRCLGINPESEQRWMIRGLRGWTVVPIIVLSVREREADKVAALDVGADDYVTKRVRDG